MSNKKEYTFLWFIENYSYCWHKNGEMLVSPEFNVDGLEGTAWSLRLYPRGFGYIDEGGICMHLNRNEDDGPDVLTIALNLAVLGQDGSIFFSNSNTFDFVKDTKWGFSFVVTDDVLERRKADYLPNDILTVRCRLWNSNGNTDKVAPICARTRIGIEHISFLHALEGFSALEPNQKKSFQIRSPSKNEHVISCSVYISDEEMLMIEITPLSSGLILAKCELSLLEVSGKKIKCAEADNRFDPSKKVIHTLTLSLTKDAIMSRKNEYLPDDKLSLLYECIFSTGIEFQQIEGTVSYSDIKKNYTEKSSTCASALDDLKDIYSNNFLTDVELQTKTNSFPAHKIVLCARSPVFKVMFSNDMREKKSDSIQVDDLEDETVQQLLLFLYSDNVEDLQWETATKLYYAADKYKSKI